MFEKISEKEQLRTERAERLNQQNKQEELGELILEQMIEIDFRQSIMEMGV